MIRNNGNWKKNGIFYFSNTMNWEIKKKEERRTGDQLLKEEGRKGRERERERQRVGTWNVISLESMNRSTSGNVLAPSRGRWPRWLLSRLKDLTNHACITIFKIEKGTGQNRSRRKKKKVYVSTWKRATEKNVKICFLYGI